MKQLKQRRKAIDLYACFAAAIKSNSSNLIAAAIAAGEINSQSKSALMEMKGGCIGTTALTSEKVLRQQDHSIVMTGDQL